MWNCLDEICQMDHSNKYSNILQNLHERIQTHSKAICQSIKWRLAYSERKCVWRMWKMCVFKRFSFGSSQCSHRSCFFNTLIIFCLYLSMFAFHLSRIDMLFIAFLLPPLFYFVACVIHIYIGNRAEEKSDRIQNEFLEFSALRGPMQAWLLLRTQIFLDPLAIVSVCVARICSHLSERYMTMTMMTFSIDAIVGCGVALNNIRFSVGEIFLGHFVLISDEFQTIVIEKKKMCGKWQQK